MNDVSEMISGHVYGMLEPTQVRQLADWIKADPDNARRFARETLIQGHIRQQVIGESSLRLETEAESITAAEDPIDEAFDPMLILQAVEQERHASAVRAAEPSPVTHALERTDRAATPANPPVRHLVIPRSAVYLAVAAMAAVLLFSLQFWIRPSTPTVPPAAERPSVHVAQLTEAVNCVWADAQLPTQSGAELRASKLNLVQGFARLTFRSGAQVLLQAPCTFEIKNDMRGYLHGGRVTANVPLRARGYAIETRGVQVVDLGTEFGMSIEPTTGEVEVHVFAGEIEAHMLDHGGAPQRTKRLTTEQAARFDTRNNRIASIAIDEQSFTRTTHALTAYAREVLADQPLAYWPLNEPAGAIVVEDWSGNHFHGRVRGEVALGNADGVESNATVATFNGKGQIDVGAFSQLNITGKLTLETWVKPGSLDERSGWLISAYTGAGVNHGWGLGYNTVSRFDHSRFHPGIRLGLFDVTDYDFDEATALLKKETWHHWVVTLDGQGIGRFYLDGKHVQTIAGTQSAIRDNFHVVIGGVHDAPSYFRGALAHVAIYNRVLGEDRIEAHYLATFQPQGQAQAADGD